MLKRNPIFLVTLSIYIWRENGIPEWRWQELECGKMLFYAMAVVGPIMYM